MELAFQLPWVASLVYLWLLKSHSLCLISVYMVNISCCLDKLWVPSRSAIQTAIVLNVSSMSVHAPCHNGWVHCLGLLL